jgi:hypothetical protein
MAKRVIVIDDLDGTEPAHPTTFELDHFHYEIELLDPYIQAGRVVRR